MNPHEENDFFVVDMLPARRFLKAFTNYVSRETLQAKEIIPPQFYRYDIVNEE